MAQRRLAVEPDRLLVADPPLTFPEDGRVVLEDERGADRIARLLGCAGRDPLRMLGDRVELPCRLVVEMLRLPGWLVRFCSGGLLRRTDGTERFRSAV
jgi:hypothetical protein